MKIQNLCIICSLGMSMFLSCQDDETLNLENYPINKPTIIVEDADKLPQKLQATYQNDGSLSLDGSLSRTYVCRFKASPEEMVVDFTPIATNIPMEKVSLSTKQVKLAPGETDAVVTVSLQDDDFSFATTNFNEEKYELGVKADVRGYNIVAEPIEKKLVIEKEAYKVFASFDGANNNTARFTRTLAAGAIQEGDPISYSFKVALDKPASKDVTLSIETEGIDEQFSSDVTIAPANIVIPAGKTTSEVVTWTVGNKFLMADQLPAVYNLKLKLVVSTEDETVQKEALNEVNVQVEKRVVNVGILNAVPSDWTEINKSNFSPAAMTHMDGNPDCLFDGQSANNSGSVSAYMWFMPATFGVNMAESRTVKGIRINYTDYYGSIACATDLTIYTSTDGTNWVEQANMPGLTASYEHVFKFYAPVTASHIKVSCNAVNGYILGICELTVFE